MAGEKNFEVKNIPAYTTKDELLKLFKSLQRDDDDDIRYILYPLLGNRNKAFICFKRFPENILKKHLTLHGQSIDLHEDIQLLTYNQCSAEVDALIIAIIPNIPECIEMLQKEYGIEANYCDATAKFVLRGSLIQLQSARERLDEIFREQESLQKFELLQLQKSDVLSQPSRKEQFNFDRETGRSLDFRASIKTDRRTSGDSDGERFDENVEQKTVESLLSRMDLKKKSNQEGNVRTHRILTSDDDIRRFHSIQHQNPDDLSVGLKYDQDQQHHFSERRTGSTSLPPFNNDKYKQKQEDMSKTSSPERNMSRRLRSDWESLELSKNNGTGSDMVSRDSRFLSNRQQSSVCSDRNKQSTKYDLNQVMSSHVPDTRSGSTSLSAFNNDDMTNTSEGSRTYRRHSSLEYRDSKGSRTEERSPSRKLEFTSRPLMVKKTEGIASETKSAFWKETVGDDLFSQSLPSHDIWKISSTDYGSYSSRYSTASTKPHVPFTSFSREMSSAKEMSIVLEAYVAKYVLAVQKTRVDTIRALHSVEINLRMETNDDIATIVFMGRDPERASEKFVKLYEEVFNDLIQKNIAIDSELPEVSDVIKRIQFYRNSVLVVSDVPGLISVVGPFEDVMKAIDMLKDVQEQLEGRRHKSGSHSLSSISSRVRNSDDELDVNSREEHTNKKLFFDDYHTGKKSAITDESSHLYKMSHTADVSSMNNRTDLKDRASHVSEFTIKSSSRFQMNFKNCLEVSVYTADITKLRVDAIANAANMFLKNYGGVAAAIERAGGSRLRQDCEDLVHSRGPLEVAEVVHTKAHGDLICEYVIHVVGPQWYMESDKEKCAAMLQRAFENVLTYVNQTLQISSLAVPAIGTGMFEIPLDVCARALYWSINEFLKRSSPERSLKFLHIVNHDPSTTEMIQAVFTQLEEHSRSRSPAEMHRKSIDTRDGSLFEEREPKLENIFLDSTSSRCHGEYLKCSDDDGQKVESSDSETEEMRGREKGKDEEDIEGRLRRDSQETQESLEEHPSYFSTTHDSNSDAD